jgi:hypothetical protein
MAKETPVEKLNYEQALEEFEKRWLCSSAGRRFTSAAQSC